MTHEELEAKVAKMAEYIKSIAPQFNDLARRVKDLEDKLKASTPPASGE
jgi:hypothetical protein